VRALGRDSSPRGGAGQPADPPPDPDKTTLNFFRNTEIGGLVDAYWLYNSNKVPPSYQAFDVLYNSFDVSMAELWVAKAPTADSRIGYKIRTTFGSAADIMASASGQFLKESPYKNIEEAFGSYLAPVGKGLQIDVGKFVTNAGAEVIEAKDDFNYSRSLLFQLAIPLYHSGVRLTYSPSDKVTLTDETMRALDDLVRSGKVRYLGFSDTPAWKVVEAQMLARFNGWAPVTANQIPYSLVERTVEGDLLPMAGEFALGVTPWSPLAGGVLTGKYTRENASTKTADRGERVTSVLTERNFAIVDELLRIARELGTTPSAVALAWVQTQPGVTSTIIGARRFDQLDQNLAALDVKLDAAQAAALDRVSEPTLNFPAGFLAFAPSFMHAGATVNGEPSQVPPQMPKSDAERY
jgi:diketogulonate reductase-like aldo/keto reductase